MKSVSVAPPWPLPIACRPSRMPKRYWCLKPGGSLNKAHIMNCCGRMGCMRAYGGNSSRNKNRPKAMLGRALSKAIHDHRLQCRPAPSSGIDLELDNHVAQHTVFHGFVGCGDVLQLVAMADEMREPVFSQQLGERFDRVGAIMLFELIDQEQVQVQ